jgi:hypothetical protein
VHDCGICVAFELHARELPGQEQVECVMHEQVGQDGRYRRTQANASLDEEFTHNGELMSLRPIYLHMIEEYARHIGHADFLREQIDGATGE